MGRHKLDSRRYTCVYENDDGACKALIKALLLVAVLETPLDFVANVVNPVKIEARKRSGKGKKGRRRGGNGLR